MKKEINALTGMRGLAASWVILHHLHQDDRVNSLGDLYIYHGYLAVDFFFVLSGFVISLSYSKLFDRTLVTGNLFYFLKRRIARVWPLYAILTLFVSFIYAWANLSGASLQKISVGDIPFLLVVNLLMIQAWGLGKSLNGPAWSISTEFAAYLIFPVVCRIYSCRNFWVFTVLGAVCAFIVALLPLLAGTGYFMYGSLDLWEFNKPWPMIRCVAEFIIGMTCYETFDKVFHRYISFNRYYEATVIVSMLALIGLCNSDVLFVLMIPIIILLSLDSRSLTSRFFSNAILYYLGVISYSMYLIHYVMIYLRFMRAYIEPYLSHFLSVLATDIMAFVSVVAAAHLCYKFIEKPSRTFMERLLGYRLREHERSNSIIR